MHARREMLLKICYIHRDAYQVHLILYLQGSSYAAVATKSASKVVISSVKPLSG